MIATSDAPGLTQEAAQRKWEEVKALIARRQYEFVKAFPSSDGQPQQYVYRFRLADGEPFSTNFDCRLEEVNSWEEYEARVARQRQERFAAIRKAVAQGRFRLLDVDILLSHICLDPASGRKLVVRRIPMPDKTVIALITTYPSSEAKGGTETSWQDHLRTIAEGKRLLLDIETVRHYKYEVTLHDGSTTLFNYGGDKPLPAQGNSASPAAR